MIPCPVSCRQPVLLRDDQAIDSTPLFCMPANLLLRCRSCWLCMSLRIAARANRCACGALVSSISLTAGHKTGNTVWSLFERSIQFTIPGNTGRKEMRAAVVFPHVLLKQLSSYGNSPTSSTSNERGCEIAVGHVQQWRKHVFAPAQVRPWHPAPALTLVWLHVPDDLLVVHDGLHQYRYVVLAFVLHRVIRDRGECRFLQIQV